MHSLAEHRTWHFRRIAFFLALIVFAACTPAAHAQAPQANVTTRSLSAPHHSALFSEAIVPGALVPDWDRGYLVFRTRESLGSADSQSPTVILYDRDGQRARQARFWFPDAVRVFISDATVADDGRIIASGSVISSDGKLASFIAKTGLDGNVTQVIRTNPFVATHVCSTSDGTLWTFGHELDKEEARGDYTMLHHYNFNTGLLQEYVPRHSIPVSVLPTLAAGTPQGAYLRCGDETVALYVNPTKEYFRFDSRKGVLERYKADTAELDRMRLTGAALTNAGVFYASAENNAGANELRVRGLFELRIDAEARTAKWVPVNGTRSAMTWGQSASDVAVGRLFGTDGSNLILMMAPRPELSWVTPVREPITK